MVKVARSRLDAVLRAEAGLTFAMSARLRNWLSLAALFIVNACGLATEAKENLKRLNMLDNMVIVIGYCFKTKLQCAEAFQRWSEM